MDRTAIIAALRELFPTLRDEFAVTSIGLFGSLARGDADASSDVDIFVTFGPDDRSTYFTLARIAGIIEAAIGREIDLVADHPGLRPAFREQLERDFVRVA